MTKSIKATPKHRLFLVMVFVFLTLNSVLAQTPIPFRNEGGCGYRIESGDILLDKLERAEPFRNNLGFAKKQGKWGVVDLQMKQVIPFRFDKIDLLTPEIISCKRAQLFKLYNLTGKEIPNGPFKEVNLLSGTSDKLVVANSSGKYGVMTLTGEVVIPMVYDGPPEHLLGTDLSFLKKKKEVFNTGVLSQAGIVIVPFKFLLISRYGTDYYQCETVDREVAYYDRSGKLIYRGKSETEKLFYIDSSFLVVQKDLKEELLVRNTNSKSIASKWILNRDFVYQSGANDKTTLFFRDGRTFEKEGKWSIRGLRKGLLLVSTSEESAQKTWGLWNEEGEVVLATDQLEFTDWTAKFAVIRSKSSPQKLRLFDLQTGKPCLPDEYDEIELLNCDYVKTIKNGVQQFWDAELHRIDELTDFTAHSIYYSIPEFKLEALNRDYIQLTGGRKMLQDSKSQEGCLERMIVFSNIGRAEFVTDRSLKNPIPDRLKVVVRNQLGFGVGLLNFEGKVISSFEYASIGLHDQGLIPMAKRKVLDSESTLVWGLMDTDGREVISPQYEAIKDVIDGYAIVLKQGLFSLIEISTQKELLSGYNYIDVLGEDYLLLERFGKKGIADRLGNVLVPVNYSNIILPTAKGGLFIAERDGKKFYIDATTNEYPIE